MAASLDTLRHTHGSVLLADGADLATVSERLEHSSVRVMADIYSHELRGRDQDAGVGASSCVKTGDRVTENSKPARTRGASWGEKQLPPLRFRQQFIVFQPKRCLSFAVHGK
jgi:hypothetical protein